MIVAGLQSRCCAGYVGSRAILSQLPLTFQAFSFNFQADDAAQLRRNEIRRRVGNIPRMRESGFVFAGESVNEREQAIVVVKSPNCSVRMNRKVIPSRHDHTVMLSGVIPGGTNVRIRPYEHGERLALRVDAAPLRIRARNVAPHGAVAAAILSTSTGT